jgi:hypothetical protein
MSFQAEMTRRWPVAVYFDLDDLNTLSTALSKVPPPSRRDNTRRLARVRRKVERARTRRRKALARTRR